MWLQPASTAANSRLTKNAPVTSHPSAKQRVREVPARPEGTVLRPVTAITPSVLRLDILIPKEKLGGTKE